MRVTNRMMNDDVFRNTQAQLEKLSNLQNEIASGKAVTKPSDNPSAVNQAMLLQNTLSDQDQYVKNIDMVNTWLDTADQSLGDATTVMQRARELAVQGASGTLTPQSRSDIAKEVRQLSEQLRGIANTQIAGRYIFAGSQTLTTPYPPTNPTANPPVFPPPPVYPNPAPANVDSTSPLTAEIGPQQTIQYNVTGTDAFGATTDPNSAFQVLEDLASALDTNNTTAISTQIDRIDSRLDAIDLQRADIGGKRNRTTLLENSYSATSVSLKDLLSKDTDVDIPQVVSDMTLAQQVFQASLAAGAKIIQPTLLDFLK